jgi:hypothetical protein
MDRGAAHLKKWDTPPPELGAALFTFVNAALTLLTPVFIVLWRSLLTLLTGLLTFVSMKNSAMTIVTETKNERDEANEEHCFSIDG